MPYAIVNSYGAYVIGTPKKKGTVFTDDEEQAQWYSTKKAAENVIKASRNFENLYVVEKGGPKPALKTYTKNITADFVKSIDTNSINSQINEVCSIANYLNKRLEYLSSQLSKIERALVDVDHYDEFSSLDVYRGFLSWQLRHKLLVKRREVKNEIALIQRIHSNEILTPDKMSNFLNSRTYSPRELTDLFENIE